MRVQIAGDDYADVEDDVARVLIGHHDGRWSGYGVNNPLLLMDVGGDDATVLLVPPMPPLTALEVMQWYREQLDRHITAARDNLQMGGDG